MPRRLALLPADGGVGADGIEIVSGEGIIIIEV
jgi:hypothetical protein